MIPQYQLPNTLHDALGTIGVLSKLLLQAHDVIETIQGDDSDESRKLDELQEAIFEACAPLQGQADALALLRHIKPAEPEEERRPLMLAAINVLNSVKAWLDSDGAEDLPFDTEIGIEAVLTAWELRSREGMAHPFPKPLMLRGVGKINGDGWKDTTKMGEVVFVWNDELQAPYGPGQFPRIGNLVWSASRDQYDFKPMTAEEVRDYVEQLAMRAQEATWRHVELTPVKIQRAYMQAGTDSTNGPANFVAGIHFAERWHGIRKPVLAVDETPDEPFCLIDHLRRQRDFSRETFGPGDRTQGVCDHIRKELAEVEADHSAGKATLGEWVDVIILAFDGAWRSGAEPEQVVAAIVDKQTRNEGRTWPDWRKSDPNKAIEHVRGLEG